MSPTFDATPATVSAVAKLSIVDLEQYPDQEDFGAGDCLQLDFQPIAAYDVLKQHNQEYKAFTGAAGDTVDCTGLTPAGIACEVVSAFRIQMTIGATAATAINGVIPGLHNPFSTQPLKLNSISYYKHDAGGLGCQK